MKKLLFLLACALLLILAAAAPASATEGIQWQVLLSWHEPGWSDICRADYDTLSWTVWEVYPDVPLAAVPADAPNVAVGTSSSWVTRGNASVFAKALFQRLKVYAPDGSPILDSDDPEHRGAWSAPYRVNDWTNPGGPLFAYNPRIGGGMQWAVDWLVPLQIPRDTAGNPMTGEYTVEYWNMLTHRVADPMFLSRGKPGGEGYPPIGGPWDWNDEPMEYHFYVE